MAQDLGLVWGPLQRGFACRLYRSMASLAGQAEISNHVEVYESVLSPLFSDHREWSRYEFHILNRDA
jgi:hypothetical protein